MNGLAASNLKHLCQTGGCDGPVYFGTLCPKCTEEREALDRWSTATEWAQPLATVFEMAFTVLSWAVVAFLASMLLLPAVRKIAEFYR